MNYADSIKSRLKSKNPAKKVDDNFQVQKQYGVVEGQDLYKAPARTAPPRKYQSMAQDKSNRIESMKGYRAKLGERLYSPNEYDKTVMSKTGGEAWQRDLTKQIDTLDERINGMNKTQKPQSVYNRKSENIVEINKPNYGKTQAANLLGGSQATLSKGRKLTPFQEFKSKVHYKIYGNDGIGAEIKEAFGADDAGEAIRKTGWSPKDWRDVGEYAVKNAKIGEGNTVSIDTRQSKAIKTASNVVNTLGTQKDKDTTGLKLENAKSSWQVSPAKAFATNVNAGVQQAGAGIAGVAKMLGGEYVPILNTLIDSTINATKTASENAQKYNKGVAGKAVGAVSQGLTSMIPYAAMSLMTGGTALAAKLGTSMPKAAAALTKLAKNSTFLYSLVTTMGNEYQQALDSGADEKSAMKNAVMTSLPSAMIEIGSGFGADDVLDQTLLQTIIGEVGEEISQDFFANLGHKSTFNKDMPIFSSDIEQDALINPAQMAQTAALTAATAGIAGAGMKGINSLMRPKFNSALEENLYNAGANGLTFEQISEAAPDIIQTVGKPNAFKAWAQGQHSAEIAKDTSSPQQETEEFPPQTAQAIEMPQQDLGQTAEAVPPDTLSQAEIKARADEVARIKQLTKDAITPFPELKPGANDKLQRKQLLTYTAADTKLSEEEKKVRYPNGEYWALNETDIDRLKHIKKLTKSLDVPSAKIELESMIEDIGADLVDFVDEVTNHVLFYEPKGVEINFANNTRHSLNEQWYRDAYKAKGGKLNRADKEWVIKKMLSGRYPMPFEYPNNYFKIKELYSEYENAYDKIFKTANIVDYDIDENDNVYAIIDETISPDEKTELDTAKEPDMPRATKKGPIFTDRTVEFSMDPSPNWDTERVKTAPITADNVNKVQKQIAKAEKSKDNGLSNIIARIEHDFKIPVSRGNIRAHNALGVYGINRQTIRSRNANDLPTIAHELGHHLDHTYGLTADIGRAGTELIDNMKPAFKASYTQDKWLTEGLAEFVRKYLQNYENAQNEYPLFTKILKQRLPAEQMKLLNKFANEINAYYSLDKDTATSSIVSGSRDIDYRNLKEKAIDKKDALYQALIDSNHGIKMFSEFANTDTPYMLATNSAYADAVSYSVVTSDLTNMNGEKVGAGLAEALKGVNTKNKTEYIDFGEYLVVRHAPQRMEKGMRIFADDRKNTIEWTNARRETLENKYPKFEKAAENLYEFQTSFLKTWGVDTGLVSPAAASKYINQWEDYVPLNRAVEKQGSGIKKGYANQNSTIKKARGSGLDIVHPIENIIRNSVKMVNAALLNNVMLEISNVATDTQGSGSFLEQVPATLDVQKVNSKALKEKLRNSFAANLKDETSVDTAFDIIENDIDDILIQYNHGKAYGDIVTVLRNGKAEYWKINDPLLLQSVAQLSPVALPGWLRAYGKVTRFITGNITGNNLIWSIFSNAPRDLMTFLTFSKDKNLIKIVGNIADGWLNSAKSQNGNASAMFKEYQAIGGGHISISTESDNMAAQIAKKFKGKGAQWLNPMEYVDMAGDMIESGPRFAYYKMMRNKGLTPQEAFYASQDITVNFRRGGTETKQLNKLIPFLNASVQGLNRFSRWITADDIPKAKRAKAITARMGMYITTSIVIAAITTGINSKDKEDEENYKQLSAYTKNSFWNIPLGDGKYFAIPKPREIAVLSSAFERCIEVYKMDNPNAFKSFGEYAANNLLPTLVSDLAMGDINGALGSLGILGTASYMNSNKDFRGNPIVSRGMDMLEPRQQYDNRTTKIAKELGDVFNASPKKIDFFFNAVFGGFHKAVAALTPVGDAEKDLTLGVRNTYIKDNRYSTDVINDFYDNKEAASMAHKTNGDDMAVMIKNKDYSTVASFYSNYASLAKNNSHSKQGDLTRQTVIEMIAQFNKEQSMGKTTQIKQRLDDYAKENADTELFPSVMPVVLKIGKGDKAKEKALSDSEYVEYQTLYLKYYYEYIEKAFRKVRGKDQKQDAKTIRAAKAEALDKTKAEMARRLEY